MPSNEEIVVTRLFARRWRMMCAVSATFMIAAALLTAVMPRRYQSMMKFLVSDERADLVMTPERNPQEPSPPILTEAEVNSEIELLNSQDILKSVVMSNRLYSPSKGGDNDSPTPRSVQRAITRLKKDLNIAVIHRANIIDVEYKANSPENAVSVLRSLGDGYLAVHLAAHSAPGSSQFFSNKVAQYASELQTTRHDLAEFHNHTKLFSLPQQQTAAIGALQSNDVEMKDVGVRIAELQGRIAADRVQLLETTKRIATQETSVPNQLATQQLEGILSDLKNRRITLSTKLNPGDRLLIEVNDQIASTSEEINRLRDNPANQQTTDLNPVHQSIESELSRSQVDLHALEAREAALSEVRSAYFTQLKELDDNSLRLQQLEQAEKEARSNYDLYTTNMDEAQLARSMDEEKFSNVRMVESPNASPIPVSPKLSINLAGGAVLGFLCSFALAFYQESRNPALEAVFEQGRQTVS